MKPVTKDRPEKFVASEEMSPAAEEVVEEDCRVTANVVGVVPRAVLNRRVAPDFSVVGDCVSEPVVSVTDEIQAPF